MRKCTLVVSTIPLALELRLMQQVVDVYLVEVGRVLRINLLALHEGLRSRICVAPVEHRRVWPTVLSQLGRAVSTGHIADLTVVVCLILLSHVVL